MLRNWSLNPLAKAAIGILRSYGADAHVYLPGIGTVSGLTAGNYLDSAGTTAATVDNPVGLVVDSFGAVNATQATTANKPILRRGLLNQLPWSNDLTNAAYSLDMGGAALPVVTANAGIDPSGNLTADRLVLNKTGGTFSRIAQSIVASVGQPYTMGVWMKTYAGGTANVGIRLDLTGINQLVTSAWTLSAISATATIGTTSAQILLFDSIIGNDETADILVGGMGLFQGTYTAQQIIDAGGIPLTTTAAASSTTGKYWGQFDSTDLLTATYPAGYESATIINALTSGVTTTQGVNVVGSYSIGPSVNTAGRIVLKTAPTAEKLAVLQSFMGLLI